MNAALSPRVFACIPLAVLLALLFFCAGCQERADKSEASVDEAALERHRQQVEDLERRMAAIAAMIQAGGEGAYRAGPTMGVDKAPGSSVLEKLHELQIKLQEALAEKQDLLQRLGGVRGQLAEAQKHLAQYEEDNVVLKRYRDSAETARTEAKELLQENGELRKELRALEAHLLQAQRLLYATAADLLQLQPLQTQALNDLKERVKAAVATLAPAQQAAKAATGKERR